MRKLTALVALLAATGLARLGGANGAESVRIVDAIAPGLTRTSLRFGAPATGSRFVVVAGIERRQRDADLLLERVEALGFEAEPLHSEAGYEIRAIGFDGRAAAERALAALAAGGLAGAEVREIGQDLTWPGGPFAVEILEVDPSAIDVVLAHAADAARGLETTSAMARRRGALAAVNGGYFRDAGPLAGDNQGLLVLGGRLLSEPDRGRAGVAFFDEGDAGRDRALFDRLGWCGIARRSDGAEIAIDGIDRARGAGEVVLYTREFGSRTETGGDGLEVVLAAGRVRELRRGEGTIPDGGAVLSFAPGAETAIGFSSGELIAIQLRLLPRGGDPERLWERAHSATGGGPLLLAGGRDALEPSLEAISRVFVESRHPRTAAAARADGTLLFVTVDGRRPERSVGMTLPELARLLRSLGAVDAVNLDGGGSTTMVVGGETVNVTSDAGGERAVGDAILFFARRGR